MPLINAIGSSLVSVTVFGLTTAASYAWSGLVDWKSPACSWSEARSAECSAPGLRPISPDTGRRYR